MKELPYDFDLLYDIKYGEELRSIFNGEPHRTSATIEDLYELMEIHDIKKEDIMMKEFKDGMTVECAGCNFVIRDVAVHDDGDTTATVECISIDEGSERIRTWKVGKIIPGFVLDGGTILDVTII